MQKVKDAVRLRNGIHSHETLEQREFETSAEASSHDEDGKPVRSL